MRKLLSLFAAALLVACSTLPTDYRGPRVPRQATIVPLKSDRPLVALALGGGGTRGFAHIGVLKAFEEAGMAPDIITGCSSGAVVAALYASGRRAHELEKIALDVNQGDLLDFILFGDGWIRGEALQEFVNRLVLRQPIEKLARPFAAIATEAKTGRMVAFNRGDTGLAVRASASIPNLFVPPVINGKQYVDGGLSSPVPVKVARSMGADIVIAVDVAWYMLAHDKPANESAPYWHAVRYPQLAAELDAADLVVTPLTARTRILNFDYKQANIEAGESAGRDALPQLRELLERVAAVKKAGREDPVKPE